MLIAMTKQEKARGEAEQRVWMERGGIKDCDRANCFIVKGTVFLFDLPLLRPLDFINRLNKQTT